MRRLAAAVGYERAVARRLFLRSASDDEEREPEDPEMGGDASQWNRLTGWEDAYGFSLLLLLVSLLLPVFVDAGTFLTTFTAALVVTACLIALHSSRVRAALLWVTTALCAIGAAILTFDEITESDDLRAVALVCLGLLFVVTPIAILVRIARHKVVTPRTLYGALTVYLLLGIGFSFLYQALNRSDPGSFPAITSEHDRGAYAYYSFITLTTTGYGDIVPATSSARSLATFEVVIGQVFLVVIVARVVSMLGHERPPSTHRLVDRIHREDPPSPRPPGEGPAPSPDA
jgi:hypothetical protein